MASTSNSSNSNDGTGTSTLQMRAAPVNKYDKLVYNSALIISVACPVIALLPPRKMDLFTLGLGIAFFTCTGIVVEQRTGNGLVYHVGQNLPTSRNRARWRHEAEEQREGFGDSDGWREERVRGDYTGKLMERVMMEQKKSALGSEEAEKWRRGLRDEEQEQENERRQKRSMWRKVWTGDEKDNWVEERRKKEEEAFREGRGYGDLIMDQLKEVFGSSSTSTSERDADTGTSATATDSQSKK